MPIQTLEEFDKVLNVSWYTPSEPQEPAYVVNPHHLWHCYATGYTKLSYFSFPCVLPFSQMYPLCCIDIRNFLNQFYFFANDDFSNPNIIDETLKDVRIRRRYMQSRSASNSIRHWTNSFLVKYATHLLSASTPSIWDK